MSGYYFFVDTTRCIACRGCQVACKEWHKLSALPTRQWGSPQNPPDLNANTYRLVRFREYERGEKTVRYFFSDACRHCLEPPCKDEADKYVKDAIVIDRTGAVVYTSKTKELGENAEKVIEACPYNIPRLDRDTGMLTKCDMCYTRIKEGLEPICVKSCPAGGLSFGSEQAMKKLARERLDIARRKFGGDALLLSPDEVRSVYLVTADPEDYYEFADS